MSSTPAARLFKRALQEKLADWRKVAFIPAPEEGQAAGPGGQQVGPEAGGAPPPPGGAPMDPMAAGGAPPVDPMAAGGMPPMDPMAAGGEMPPMPEGDLPPLPEEGGGEGGEDSVTGADADTIKNIQMNTMDIVKQTLDMVDFKRKKDEQGGEAAPSGEAPEAVAEAPAEPPAPEAQPGPITGQPGFSPDMVGGPLKLSSALTRGLKKAEDAAAMASTTGKDSEEGDIGDDGGMHRYSAGRKVSTTAHKLASLLRKKG